MASGDFVTLAQVKTYLGITVTTSDAKLSELISESSAWVQSYLNRDILQTTYTEMLNGTGTRRITLANYPVTAVSSVIVDGYDVTANVVRDGRRTLALVDPQPGSPAPTVYCRVFTRNLCNVSVTYTAGYATVPTDLIGTVIKMVAWAWTESTRLQQKSKSFGGEVISYDMNAAPDWAMRNLNNWKKVID